MVNIERRGILCDTLCVCCKRLDEDGAHLFLKCKEMRGLWKSIGMEELCDRMSTYENAQALVQEILLLNDEKKVLILCLLWRWWLQRNKRSREGKNVLAEIILRQARYWAVESLQYCRKETIPAAPSPSCRWRKPIGESLKINLDGAYLSETRQGGWGFIVRDE
jgi:hypothetical protein